MAREGKPPAFPLYADHELADSELALAGPAAKGVYLDLRCYCWRDGSIPADPAKLAKLVRLTPARFAPIWALISARFTLAQSPNPVTNRLVHGDLETERARMAAHSQQQSNRAKARWAADAAASGGHEPDESGDRKPEAVQPPQSSSFASALADEDQTHTHPREGVPELPEGSVPLTRAALGTAWDTETKAYMPDATGMHELLERLVGVITRTAAATGEAVNGPAFAATACRAFVALRKAWERKGFTMGPTPYKMIEHIGLVQEVLRGDLDPEQIQPPRGRRGGGDAGASPRGRVPVSTNRTVPDATRRGRS
jgi:uncharacterized protein YdaU (DUF1376 family)